MTLEQHAKLLIGDVMLSLAKLKAENDALRALLTPEQIAAAVKKAAGG